jgi:7,8-dihydro-6-hydroxymethylpterin dimethyltransferase
VTIVSSLSSPPLEPPYLSDAEIEAFAPYPLPPSPAGRWARLKDRLEEAGCFGPGQIGGRRWPIGCVSLEVTQRCNLDCSLCYLSEHSEAVRDIPLEELFRRIDMIEAHFGEHTDIQVSGGEPTLRRREDLIRIVRRISEKGMRASLFTNGIRATRELLTALSEAGLTDVAFHVDLTQGRKGYDSEAALNVVRERYIERARGLPLAVFFNTTVFAGNSAGGSCRSMPSKTM